MAIGMINQYNGAYDEFMQAIRLRNQTIANCQAAQNALNRTGGILLRTLNPFGQRICLFSTIPHKVAVLTAQLFSTVIYGLAAILTLGRDRHITLCFQKSAQTVKKKALEIPFALYAIFGPQKGLEKYYDLKPDDMPWKLYHRPNNAPNANVA